MDTLPLRRGMIGASSACFGWWFALSFLLVRESDDSFKENIPSLRLGIVGVSTWSQRVPTIVTGSRDQVNFKLHRGAEEAKERRKVDQSAS